MPRLMLEWRDAEELLFLSRLAQPGASQISKGELEHGGHTPEASQEYNMMPWSRHITI